MNEQDLHRLLEENLEYSRSIKHDLEKVRSYIFWGKVFTFIQLLLFIVPLILAIIYLPPLLNNLLGGFSGVLENGASTQIDKDSVQGLLDQYKEFLDNN